MASREKTTSRRTIAAASGVVGIIALECAGKAVLRVAAGEIFAAFFFAVSAIGLGWLAADTWQARR